jgi:[acyl-carrier-protein] S-malonyltransferase
MSAHGVTTFIEIGPAKVLTGLIKRISKEATLKNIGDLASAKNMP